MKKILLSICIIALALFTALPSYAQKTDSTALSVRRIERGSEVEPKMLTNLSDFLVYPESAMKNGLEGKVYLSVLIGKDGKPEHIDVVRSTDSVFIKPAVNAMKHMTFSPAKQHGEAVRAWWTVPISFTLNRKKHNDQ